MSYQDYHKNTINKFIHVICIPIIMVTSINFFHCIKFKINDPKSGMLGSKIIHKYKEYGCDYITAMVFPLYYFFFYSNNIGIIMSIFTYVVYKIGGIWRTHDINWKKHSIILFINAWALQFIGHFIEGNRPALFSSLQMAVFEAPLYTLQSLFSFSIDNRLSTNIASGESNQPL